MVEFGKSFRGDEYSETNAFGNLVRGYVSNSCAAARNSSGLLRWWTLTMSASSEMRGSAFSMACVCSWVSHPRISGRLGCFARTFVAIAYQLNGYCAPVRGPQFSFPMAKACAVTSVETPTGGDQMFGVMQPAAISA